MDNLFTGTIPTTWNRSDFQVSLAYNPLLVGPVPPLTLLTYSVTGAVYYTFGTSLGLDRCGLADDAQGMNLNVSPCVLFLRSAHG